MKEHYFFDNASTTWPKPEVVYDTMASAGRELGVNPGRSGYGLAFEAEQMIAQTRRRIGEFFSYRGDPNRVVFGLNATDSLNAALFGVLEPGDHVVTTRLEHNSVLRPLHYLERDHGVSVSYVGSDPEGYVDPEKIRSSVTNKTRMIVVNHASNVLGTVQDIESIGAIAREAGSVFVIDSCQSAGVIPIDFDEACIDLLTFTGHKGLFGPMGTGGMIVREGVAVRPTRYGGSGVDSLSPFQPEQYPYHLEAGTIALPGVAGLNAAQTWFAALGREQAQDRDKALGHTEACRLAQTHIHAVEMRHLMRLDRAFRSLDRVTVHGPATPDRRVSTLSISIEGMAADEAGAILDADYHVCVRAGLHCAPLVHHDLGTVSEHGTIRFAPGYFTDDEDVDHAIQAVTEIAGLPKPTGGK